MTQKYLSLTAAQIQLKYQSEFDPDEVALGGVLGVELGQERHVEDRHCVTELAGVGDRRADTVGLDLKRSQRGAATAVTGKLLEVEGRGAHAREAAG